MQWLGWSATVLSECSTVQPYIVTFCKVHPNILRPQLTLRLIWTLTLYKIIWTLTGIAPHRAEFHVSETQYSTWVIGYFMNPVYWQPASEGQTSCEAEHRNCKVLPEPAGLPCSTAKRKWVPCYRFCNLSPSWLCLGHSSSVTASASKKYLNYITDGRRT